MSIIADKKNGKLTGRFRVQVMVNYQLYRRRVDTLGEARELERMWLEAKAGGAAVLSMAPSAPQVPQANVVSLVPPATTWTFSKAREAAAGRVWKGATETNSLAQLRIMEELMGDVNLDAIDTAWSMELKAKLSQRKPVLSAGTINRYLAVFSRFLSWAADCGYRTSTVAPKIAKEKESEGRLRWFSEAEEATLLKLLPERTAKLVRFAILTGGRRGELLKLTAQDVHADRILLWGEGTKSGKSRPILLTKEGLALADWLVTKGNMPTKQMLKTDWNKVRKAMGFAEDREFVFHTCRHTFAVRAVEAGVDIRTLQAWLGHESIEMTEKYGKVSGLALANARDRMFAQAA